MGERPIHIMLSSSQVMSVAQGRIGAFGSTFRRRLLLIVSPPW